MRTFLPLRSKGFVVLLPMLALGAILVIALGRTAGTDQARVAGQNPSVPANVPNHSDPTLAQNLAHVNDPQEGDRSETARSALQLVLRHYREGKNGSLQQELQLFMALGPESVPAICEALDNMPSVRERMLLCTLLGQQSTPTAFARFESMLGSDPEEDVRKHLARILGNHPGRQTDRILAAALTKEKESGVLLELIRAASDAGAAGALGGLADLVSHGPPQVRKAAALAMATLPEAGGKVSLESLAGSSDSDTASAARAGLATLGSQSAIDQLSTEAQSNDPESRIRALSSLRSVRTQNPDAPVAAIFKRSLDDADARVRREALAGMVQGGRPADVEAIKNLLAAQPDPGRRAEVVSAIAGASAIPSEERSRFLNDALQKETNVKVRTAIVGLYGTLEGADPVACSVLLKAIRADDEPSFALLASQTLYHYAQRLPEGESRLYRDSALQSVRDLLTKATDPSTRGRAATILGGLGGEEDLRRLEGIVSADPSDEVKARAQGAADQIKSRLKVSR